MFFFVFFFTFSDKGRGLLVSGKLIVRENV